MEIKNDLKSDMRNQLITRKNKITATFIVVDSLLINKNSPIVNINRTIGVAYLITSIFISYFFKY
jgi:hypothetical protein